VAPASTKQLHIGSPPLTLSTKPLAVGRTVEAAPGDPGEGPGSGAPDTTAQTVSGADASPGLDSTASDIFGPTPLLLSNAPPGAPVGDQRTREVRFSIGVDGRVTRIEVIPPIKDSRYHRVFMKAMKDVAFSPAKTRDGRAIDYVYSIVVHP
jgi:hypothetical protein